MSVTTVTIPDAPPTIGLRSALTIVASALSGLAVAGLLLLIICTQLLGYHALTVVSGSMTPTVQKGDVIFTRPVAPTSVKYHDIVLFRSTAQHHPVVVHRVVGFINIEMDTIHRSTGKKTVTHTRMLRTKGDANAIADPSPVAPRQLEGKLWFKLPGVGRLVGRAGLVTALPFIAGISGAIWLLSEVRDRRRRQDAAI